MTGPEVFRRTVELGEPLYVSSQTPTAIGTIASFICAGGVIRGVIARQCTKQEAEASSRRVDPSGDTFAKDALNYFYEFVAD